MKNKRSIIISIILVMAIAFSFIGCDDPKADQWEEVTSFSQVVGTWKVALDVDDILGELELEDEIEGFSFQMLYIITNSTITTSTTLDFSGIKNIKTDWDFYKMSFGPEMDDEYDFDITIDDEKYTITSNSESITEEEFFNDILEPGTFFVNGNKTKIKIAGEIGDGEDLILTKIK